MDKETLSRYFKVVDIKCISGLFYFVILQALAAIILGANTVTLEPKDGHVVKGENLTLTCSASGSQWLNFSTWLVSSQTQDAFISYNHITNECTVTGIFANKSQFESGCDGNHQYSTVIMNVGTGRHGETWGCRMIALTGTVGRSNDVTINVDVPVTKIRINDSTWSTNVVRENTNLTLQCVTSPSRPLANITWHFVDEDGNSNNVDLAEKTTIAIENNLTTTRTSIWFNASRDMNGWSVRCYASNIRNYSVVTTSVEINVTFPTNVPTIQCLETGTYGVIRHRLSNLTCSVDGGNPAGRLEWSCNRNFIHNQLPQSTLSRTMVLNATEDVTCTCMSTNVAGNREAPVSIDVLYPPVLKEINNISIIEGDPLFLQCDVASSNPSARSIGWTSKTHNVSGATLIIQNVSRTDDTMYTCTANNTMEPSCGDVVIGSTSIYMHLDIMNPPLVTIQPSKHFTRNESDLFYYTCPIAEGNPSSTTVLWRRSSDNTTWNSSTLFLPNVSRHDDSVYICYATNVMTDSNGTTRYGTSSGNITLHVQFGANVTYFYIKGHEQHSSAVVMEHTNLTFECRVQSKPTADIRILMKNTTVKSSNANVLVYHTTASCSREQVLYRCKGNNLLSTEPSTKDVQLTVKCKPRADTTAAVQLIVASAINQTVTMSYTALAYPHPSFIWYRNGSSIGTSDPRTSVSSSSQQTNLTIEHVVESDFGEYYLNASNDVGFINEVFHLKPEEPVVMDKFTTTQNVSAIVGGTCAGVIILCIIAALTFLFRRRSMKDKRPESSTDQPITYENLKIEQIPNAPLDYQRETSNNETPGRMSMHVTHMKDFPNN